MYKGCWLKAQTKSMIIPDVNLTNDMELLHTGVLVVPHSSRYWNRLLCSPSSRPGGRELSCKLGNYFGLRKLGSRQQLREIDIGQIPYLVIMVVSF